MPLKWKCPNYFKIFKNDRNVKQISCTKSPGVPFFLSHSTKTTKGWLFKNFLVHFLSNQTNPKFKELTIKQTLQAYTLKSPISGTSPTSENKVILNPTMSGQPPQSVEATSNSDELEPPLAYDQPLENVLDVDYYKAHSLATIFPHFPSFSRQPNIAPPNSSSISTIDSSFHHK